MNETETQQLYQIIFGGDRSKGWQSWKGNLAAAADRNEGIASALVEISEAAKDPDKTHHSFKGGERVANGYVMIRLPIHPKACNSYVQEHVLVAESVLGKFLPNEAVVHHVNEDKLDNRPENLVICENNGFHLTLHRRMRALKACGNPDWRKCPYCKTWDDPKNLVVRGKGEDTVCHKSCLTAWSKANYERRKAKEGQYWKKPQG